MAETALTAPAPPPSTDSDAASARRRAGRLADWQIAVLVAIVLLAVSTGIVVWARTRPGFDPYGWLVWGQQTLKWSLNTNAAPSWKPLPYLFTVPYALAGHYQLWLWMTTAVAVSLSGGIFAWRIAWFLVDPPPDKRYAGYAAGAFAVAGVYGIVAYAHYVFSAQSDSMIVALVLGATDCWLRGRQRWALVLFWLGALGRPEVWPFMLLHSVWCGRRDPSMRRLLIGAWITIPLLWYGIPGLTARTPFISQDQAL